MSGRAVILTTPQDPNDPNSPVLIAEIDRHSQMLVTLDGVHARIHDGTFFSTGLADAALTNNASLEILIQTPAGAPLHMRIDGAAGGDARAQFFENTTFSVAGAALVPQNRNRRSGNTAPNGTFTSAPTITLDGDTVFDSFLLGGTGGNAVGGSLSTFSEYILASSTNYLLRLQNISGQTHIATLSVNFYDTGLEPYV